MDINTYQRDAYGFANYPERLAAQGRDTKLDRLNYTIHGLTGEAGEIANKFKKVLRDNEGVLDLETVQMLKQELGDVLWYVAAIATELEDSLFNIADMNLWKLDSRRERGTLDGSGDDR